MTPIVFANDTDNVKVSINLNDAKGNKLDKKQQEKLVKDFREKSENISSKMSNSGQEVDRLNAEISELMEKLGSTVGTLQEEQTNHNDFLDIFTADNLFKNQAKKDQNESIRSQFESDKEQLNEKSKKQNSIQIDLANNLNDLNKLKVDFIKAIAKSDKEVNDKEKEISSIKNRIEELEKSSENVENNDSIKKEIDELNQKQSKTDSELQDLLRQKIDEKTLESLKIASIADKKSESNPSTHIGDTPSFNVNDQDALFRAISGANNYFYSDYAVGQCTAWVYARGKELGLNFGTKFGDGGNWGTSAQRSGYVTDTHPHQGWAASTYGYGSPAAYGHVMFVEQVNPDGSFEVSEMNVKGLGILSYRHFDANASGITFVQPK